MQWGSSSPCCPQFGNGDTWTCRPAVWCWGLWVFSSRGKGGPQVGVRCSGAPRPCGRCGLLCCHGGETPSQAWCVPGESLPHAATTMGSGGRFYISPQVSYSHVFSQRLFISVHTHIAYAQRPALCTWGAKAGSWESLASMATPACRPQVIAMHG